MKRLLLAFTCAVALGIAACNGGSGMTVLPPPTGQFSAASLKGTYAFVTNGEVLTAGAASALPLARTGSFSADGNGNVQAGGVEDTNSAGLVNTGISITGGSYTVGADGRGTLTLDLNSGGVASSINFGIVLTSTSGGQMIDETSTTTQASTGSGNFLLQNTALFSISGIANSYVFDFSGLDGSQSVPCPCPESFVGQFAASNGAITTGLADLNDDGVLSPSLSIGGGILAQDNVFPATLASSGRGVAQIAGETFVFYIVDATRVRFMSTGGGAMLTGDAVLQTGLPANVAAINSGFSFLIAGSSGTGGLIRVGRFSVGGSSISNVLVDTNNNGVFTQTTGATAPGITFDPTTGRGTATFLGNGLNVPFSFVFYLSSASQGVIQETTASTQGVVAAVADGTLAAQSGSPFSTSNISGNYAINWTGQSVQNGTADEEDLVGQAAVSSLALTGAADIFQFQDLAPQPNNALGGSIAIGGDGTGGDGKTRSTMLVKLTQGGGTTTVNFVVYFVNPQLAFFANTSTSSTRIVAGTLQAQ